MTNRETIYFLQFAVKHVNFGSNVTPEVENKIREACRHAIKAVEAIDNLSELIKEGQE